MEMLACCVILLHAACWGQGGYLPPVPPPVPVPVPVPVRHRHRHRHRYSQLCPTGTAWTTAVWHTSAACL